MQGATPFFSPTYFLFRFQQFPMQGCINRSSLPAGLGARGVSSEHVENMEHRALVLGGKFYMYHSDETRFYQTDDSRVTRRLLKEKSKLTFVDV